MTNYVFDSIVKPKAIIAGSNISFTESDSSVIISATAGGGSVGGTGTTGYIPKWLDGTTLGDSIIQDTGIGSIIVGGKIIGNTTSSAVDYHVFGGTPIATTGEMAEFGIYGNPSALSNSDLLIGLRVKPTFGKNTRTGLTAYSLYVDGLAAQTGTIASFATVGIVEKQLATASVGLLIGGHPGGSQDYAAYFNSTNPTFLSGTFFVGVPYSSNIAVAIGKTVSANISGKVYQLQMLGTVTAAADANVLYGGFYSSPTFAKSTFANLSAYSAYYDVAGASGTGFIARYATVAIVESTIGTSSVGLLIGAHPNTSGTNYSIYSNSTNGSYFGGGLNLNTAGAGIGVIYAKGTTNLGAWPTGGNFELAGRFLATTSNGGFDLGGTSTGGDGVIAPSSTNKSIRFGYYNGATYVESMVVCPGIQIGSPTGNDKGVGTINVSSNIFKNNSAYTNPDYALEWWVTGEIHKYRYRPGAKDYYRWTLAEVEDYIRKNYRLHRINDDPAGIFDMADMALEKIEELFTHVIEMNKRLEKLELTK